MSVVRSQRSITSLLMVQRLVETTGSPLKAKQYWQLLERVARRSWVVDVASAAEPVQGAPAAPLITSAPTRPRPDALYTMRCMVVSP